MYMGLSIEQTTHLFIGDKLYHKKYKPYSCSIGSILLKERNAMNVSVTVNWY